MTVSTGQAGEECLIVIGAKALQFEARRNHWQQPRGFNQIVYVNDVRHIALQGEPREAFSKRPQKIAVCDQVAEFAKDASVRVSPKRVSSNDGLWARTSPDALGDKQQPKHEKEKRERIGQRNE